MDKPLIINPGQLHYQDIKAIYRDEVQLSLAATVWDRIDLSADYVNKVINRGETVYGINTGFGKLANQKIAENGLEELQRRLILSHATGVGEYLSPSTVRLILALKINSLSQGFSGVRSTTVQHLLDLYNHKLLPCIPCKGSVGASGDLAPLAHIAAKLLGYGKVYNNENIISAMEALNQINLKPITFSPKEGLALINGTQVSTALALEALLMAEKVFHAAVITGALSVEATLSSHVPFDSRFHELRHSDGIQKVASDYRHILQNSEINRSHANCDKTQDPYSLRCQPIVMGACLDQLNYAADVLLAEANAVTDNPLVFDDKTILSGGNFHAEPVALVADAMACAIAEIGSLSERRIALLNDQQMSDLPAFLAQNAGMNSGFMMAQVTAAALVSENKLLSHPASVDSIPTSANQEDHVSMATHGARRLLTMVDHVAEIIAIELLAASQGIYFRRPLKTSAPLEKVLDYVRDSIPPYQTDRYFSNDLKVAKSLILSDGLLDAVGVEFNWIIKKAANCGPKEH